jgi:maltooligosyltrehalose trehalohydrolase
VTTAGLGATYLGDGRSRFLVWAPYARQVDLEVVEPMAPIRRMTPLAGGYHELSVEDAGPGTRYFYRLDGGPRRPDPASRYQPDDVHGASMVVDPAFAWTDAAWRAPPLAETVFYEIHVGAFTPEGTFDAVLSRLDHLKRLGVNALELMPVAQFPGSRNWGYDGVYPFAVQASYGGPDGLRRLVDGCHAAGIAVALDVVYNHMGPEGCYLADFGPYFSNRYRTVWGDALNYDGRDSDDVRRFFIESALYYLRDCHIDAFRLDAIHAIVDNTAYPFVEQLSDALHAEASRLGRGVQVIAESTLNEPRFFRTKAEHGWGLEAVWNDDFHHSIHAFLTGERGGYYADFGAPGQIEKAYREGFALTGAYSKFRGRRQGRSSAGLPPERFVVYIQNHDQAGNRGAADRIGQIVSFETQKLLAAAVLLSPFVPLVFMGEEYGDPAPFPYFVSHHDPDLVESVRRGRRAEFASFQWQGESYDPGAESTYRAAQIDPSLAESGRHRVLFELYRRLIELRREHPALRPTSRASYAVSRPSETLLRLDYAGGGREGVVLLNFGDTTVSTSVGGAGGWQLVLDTAAGRWDGPGPSLPERIGDGGAIEMQPHAAAFYERETSAVLR